jgi:hypothetical protein
VTVQPLELIPVELVILTSIFQAVQLLVLASVRLVSALTEPDARAALEASVWHATARPEELTLAGIISFSLDARHEVQGLVRPA